MSSQFRRLIWAFFLSSSGFVATYLWSKSHEINYAVNGLEKIAQVTDTQEDAQKKLAQSLQWLPLTTGDFLFDGDSIKTNNRSSVKINFDDGRSLFVDPESTIIIQKKEKEIALDLVEGSLYVDADSQRSLASADPLAKKNVQKKEIILTSNKNQIKLDGTKTLLSKSKDQQILVNVIEGSSTVKDSSGVVKQISKGESLSISKLGNKSSIDIKILSPSVRKLNEDMSMDYYVNPNSDTTVYFKWKGFPKDQEIVLLMGKDKSTLVEKEIMSPGTESIPVLMSLGTQYWQLISRNSQNKEKLNSSNLFKLTIKPKYPPTIIAPLFHAEIEAENFPANVTLKWERPLDSKSIYLEVSKDPLLTQNIVLAKKNVSTLSEYLLTNLYDGDYYWRLSTKFEDTDRMIQSDIQKFTLKKKEIKDAPALSWLENNKFNQFYLDKPAIEFFWKSDTRNDEIKKWKIEIFSENKESVFKQSINKVTSVDNSSFFKTELSHNGKYLVQIDALDIKDNVLGTLTQKLFSVEEFPLAKAPKISNENLRRSEKDNKVFFENGIVNLTWNRQYIVPEYEVEITGPTERDVNKLTINNNVMEYKGKLGTGLAPGNYQLKVTPIDQFRRRGPSSESLDFDVPTETKMLAPKLKNLNIKQNSE